MWVQLLQNWSLRSNKTVTDSQLENVISEEMGVGLLDAKKLTLSCIAGWTARKGMKGAKYRISKS